MGCLGATKMKTNEVGGGGGGTGSDLTFQPRSVFSLGKERGKGLSSTVGTSLGGYRG